MQGSSVNRNKHMEIGNGYAYLKVKLGKEMMKKMMVVLESREAWNSLTWPWKLAQWWGGDGGGEKGK